MLRAANGQVNAGILRLVDAETEGFDPDVLPSRTRLVQVDAMQIFCEVGSRTDHPRSLRRWGGVTNIKITDIVLRGLTRAEHEDSDSRPTPIPLLQRRRKARDAGRAKIGPRHAYARRES